VQADDQLEAGALILHAPNNADADVCDNTCAFVFRRITGVHQASVFDGTACPGSAPDGCLRLVTEPLTFGELLASELIDALGVTPTDLMEPNHDDLCDNAGNLQAAAGLSQFVVSDAMRQAERDAAHLSSLRKRASTSVVPFVCDSMKDVGSDGRCLHTNCIVDDRDQCYVCGTTCDNGCGAADDPLSKFIPTRVPLLFDFGNACCTHDHCYSSQFDKSTCDLAFLRDMLASCFVSNAPLIVRVFYRLPISNVATFSCPVISAVYFSAVFAGGEQAYNDAQNETLAYELSPQCAAQCPSTQVSGGRGTTQFSIDMLRTSGTFPLSYEMFTIPDQLDVFYEGNSLFSTGALVSGSQDLNIAFSGSSTLVQVRVTAPLDGTAWQVYVGCPSSV